MATPTPSRSSSEGVTKITPQSTPEETRNRSASLSRPDKLKRTTATRHLEKITALGSLRRRISAGLLANNNNNDSNGVELDKESYEENTQLLQKLSERLTEYHDMQEIILTEIDQVLESILHVDASQKHVIQQLMEKMENLERQNMDIEIKYMKTRMKIINLKKNWRVALANVKLKKCDESQNQRRWSTLLQHAMQRAAPSETELRRRSSLSNSLSKPLEDWKQASNDSTEDASNQPWLVKAKKLEYSEKDSVGEGNFGRVYKGKLSGKEVAVKKLRVQSLDEEIMEQFVKEVQIISQLRHPNIVLFMGVCLDPENIAVVTEFMTRGSVFDMLHKRPESDPPLTIQQRMSIAKQTVLGMNWLHKMEPQLLHLDLKTANLLVDEHWVVKLSDFGFSQLKATTEASSGGMVGTPIYMAPEILIEKSFGTSADVFSFGVVLYELISGHIPYHDHQFPSLNDFIEAVTLDSVRPTIDQTFPPKARELITKCWSDDPESRPAFEHLVESRIFDEIVIDHFLPEYQDIGRLLWRNHFPGVWEVPWKTFAEALLDILEVKHVGLADMKMIVLKHLLGASESSLVSLEKFAQILEWFGPLQKTAITLNYIFEIASKPYFYGILPTEQCEVLLKRKKKGTYLLRFNRKVPGSYVLSFVNKEEKIVHVPISHKPLLPFYVDNTEFPSLDDIINPRFQLKLQKAFYLKHPCTPSPFADIIAAHHHIRLHPTESFMQDHT